LRKLLAAASVALFAVPALAQDMNLIGGSWFPKDLSKDACSWSRPHIVFENNSKTRIRIEFGLGNMDQETKAILPNGRLFLEAGQQIKEIYQDQNSVIIFGVYPDSGRSYTPDKTRMNFHYCPSGTKGELSNNFPAWKFIYRKDGTYAIFERKK
jgi:hypothetical protein